MGALTAPQMPFWGHGSALELRRFTELRKYDKIHVVNFVEQPPPLFLFICFILHDATVYKVNVFF